MLKLSCVTSGPDSVIQYLLYDDNNGAPASLSRALSAVIAVSFSLFLSFSVSLVKAKTTREEKKKPNIHTRDRNEREEILKRAREAQANKQTTQDTSKKT